MKLRKIMWSSLIVQIATIIIMFALLLMQKPISDFLFGVFMISMFLCIALSFFVRRADMKEINTKENQQFNFKTMLTNISLLVPLVVLLVITHVFSA